MRAAAILGLGCSPKDLKPFREVHTRTGSPGAGTIDWRMGMPAAGDQVDVILLLGGDGTIHRHLGQLVRLGLPVLVVPAGSGNDFARALGLRRVRDSLNAWQKFCDGAGNVRTIDLGIINPLGIGNAPAPQETHPLAAGASRYFCCVAGVGLDGEVARRANQLPRWLRGHGGYVLSLAPTIFTFAPLPLKLSTPPEASLNGEGQEGKDQVQGWTTRSDRPTILAAFANAPVYGGGMKIAPQAKMDDGLLDVCVVGGVGPLKLFCMFPTVYSGNHLNIKEVEYFHAGRVRVETEHPLEVYADGEYVCHTPVEVAAQATALKVVTR